MRTSVVLPAPFGPSSPRTSPAPATRDTSSSARVSPKDLVTPSTSIIHPVITIRLYGFRTLEGKPVPKQVDHDERRRQIIEALFEVAARDGLAAATYRTIAAEAGIPAAQVQYYFATKADLLNGALFELGGRVVGRGLQLIAEAGPDPSPEVMVRAAVEGARPVDDATRR